MPRILNRRSWNPDFAYPESRTYQADGAGTDDLTYGTRSSRFDLR
jgi:hypothetical protein